MTEISHQEEGRQAIPRCGAKDCFNLTLNYNATLEQGSILQNCSLAKNISSSNS
jgi:hypothetical protein